MSITLKLSDESYLNKIVSEMFDSLKKDSTRCATQYELDNFPTMATHRIPDLLEVKYFLVSYCVGSISSR